MEEKKLGIFLVSKNNYPLLDVWANRVNTDGYNVLNIDEDSTPEQKKLGEEVCSRYGIHYMDREKKGLQNNIQSACNYFEKLGIEWIIAFQHDCYPIGSDFFSKFEDKLKTGKLDNFGVIGFDVFHDGEWNLLSRTPIQYPPHDMWVRYRPSDPIPHYYKEPHSVESVCWTSSAINIKQFNKYIIPTSDYQMFHAWDDIAFQFLYNNIHNLVIPEFRMSHEQVVKEKFDIPIKSPHADEKQREHFWGHFNHHDVWEQRWGFRYDTRSSFEKIKNNYKDTLLYAFYYHNQSSGPLKIFDL
jgi:hypothetical protein